MAFKGQIIIDTERCKGCGVCVPVCPMKCIALSKNVNAETVNDSCIGCASCAMVCPDGVISVYKKKI